jgi:hypothetical protein
VLGGVVLGLVALYDAAANDGDWAESLFGDGGGGEAAVVVLTPTPMAAGQPSPTVEPTPTEEPTATPISPIYLTPEEAIDAFFAEHDLSYIGDCEGASIETDVGAYCTTIWEDTIDTLIYRAGPTFSEYDTWLMVARLGARDDWTLVDFAEYVPEDPAPPWP